jgi:selenophosphate synthetase-related protein
MAFGGGGIGLDLDIGALGADRNRSLFGEGPHRFLAEVRDTDVERITADAEAVGIPLTCIGRSVVEPTLIIRHGLDRCIESGVGELKQIWKRSLEAIWPTS